MAGNSMRCVRCHEPVIWARNTHGGVTPINWRRDPNGNVVLIHQPEHDRPLAIVVGPADKLSPDASALPRHNPHHNTCSGKDPR